jgi:ABC-type lipoprotein export system ATPase subunit
MDTALSVTGDSGDPRSDLDPVPVIRTRRLNRGFAMGSSHIRALDGIDLEVLRVEYCAIMGPLGSGKPTLTKVIGCLDTATATEILRLFRLLHIAGNTIVLVTHDQSVADNAERIAEMVDGRIVSDSRRDLAK